MLDFSTLKKRYRLLYVGVLGNIATSLWFIPYAANFLHKIRGVKMTRPYSIYFASNAVIDNRYPEKVCILPDCIFAPFSVVLSHSFVPKGNTIVGEKEIIRETYIGRGVFVGTHVVILPGASIGDYCYVAAGSIVSGKFTSNTLIAGNPAVAKRVI